MSRDLERARQIAGKHVPPRVDGPPGSNWRVLAHRPDPDPLVERDWPACDVRNAGVFDEVVVDRWLHVEQMDSHSWWARLGDARISICVDDEGRAVSLNIDRGEYGEELPAAPPDDWCGNNEGPVMKAQTLPGFDGVAVGHEGTRREADYYATPTWCTEVLLPVLRKRVPPGSGWVFEPGIGHGAIAHVLIGAGYSVQGVDIRQEAQAECWASGIMASRADFLAMQAVLWQPDPRCPTCFEELEPVGCPMAIVGNPPYSHAQAFVEHALRLVAPGGTVAFLLRLGFLASAARAEFHRRCTPDILVLDRRPSFTGGGTDSSDYAWFIWTQGKTGPGLHLRQGGS